MRTLAMMWLAVGLAGCDGADPGSDSGGGRGMSCAGMRAGQPCVSDASIAQCRVREEQCPGEVIVLESCPVQFVCP